MARRPNDKVPSIYLVWSDAFRRGERDKKKRYIVAAKTTKQSLYFWGDVSREKDI